VNLSTLGTLQCVQAPCGTSPGELDGLDDDDDDDDVVVVVVVVVVDAVVVVVVVVIVIVIVIVVDVVVVVRLNLHPQTSPPCLCYQYSPQI